MLLQEKLKTWQLILGSASPQREKLLKQLDLDFSVKSIPITENHPSDLKEAAIPEYLANLKSKAFGTLNEKTILLTADTLIFLENQPIGKPKNKEHAKAILSELQNKTHKVISGICLRSKEKKRVFSVCSKVLIKRMSEKEINYYVEQYNPIDKSGAYGIQQWFGSVGVKKIEGCFYNIIGLPLSAVYEELSNF